MISAVEISAMFNLTPDKFTKSTVTIMNKLGGPTGSLLMISLLVPQITDHVMNPKEDG